MSIYVGNKRFLLWRAAGALFGSFLSTEASSGLLTENSQPIVTES